MAKIISYKDVKDIIFENQLVKNSLPHYKSLFDSYFLSKISPELRNLGQRSILKFIDQVTEEDCDKISDILGYTIYIPKMDTNFCKNIKASIEDLEFYLEDVSNYKEMAIYRKGDEVKILCWK